MSWILGLFATVIGGWLIVNLIGAFLVGLIARAAFPGKDQVGWPMTILLGFLGGVLGKLVFGLMHWYSGFPMGFVASVAGAFVLLLAHRLMRSNKSKPAAS
jgi:uncharacterized membrane protein YeaQ/YmgE (transglycosylase-associated protein family)